MYKPGHEPARRVSDRDLFVQRMVEALKQSEAAQQKAPSHKETVSAAYRRLQFDFPVSLPMGSMQGVHRRKGSSPLVHFSEILTW